MLNKINDEAASELKQFYSEQLEAGVKGSGEYEAHLSLGLLHWRGGGGAETEKTQYHLSEAARCVAGLYAKRKNNDDRAGNDLFEFMFPLFVVLIFGDKQSRELMANIEPCYWVSEPTREFQSVILFFDLLRRYLPELHYPDGEVKKVLDENASPGIHPFYQPWVQAFCKGILAVNAGESQSILKSCNSLLEFHRKEAQTGDWQLRVEGLMSFWSSALVVIATKSGLNIPGEIKSEYLFKG